MEQPPQQHQLQNQQPLPNDQDNNSGGGKGGSFLCRQSSTRWTPTTDQIRILKELYYTNGLRSPNAEQIQKISARLRQYGKIEGKNVFYWFQNHKARERQKKRLTNDVPMQHHRNVSAASNISSANWKPEDYSIHNKYSTFTTPGGFSSACPSSSGVFTGGQINGSYGYGSVTMEKSFRECSISSAGGNSNVGGSMSHNYGGVHIDPYGSSYTLSFDRRKINSIPTLEDYDEDQQEEEEEEEEEEGGQAEIETLPLFPVHREDINAFCSFKQNSANCYFRNWYGSDDQYGNGLELSLNSYTGQSQDFI